MLELLASLGERDLLRFFVAIRNASRSSIVEEAPDPVMLRLAEEYRATGFSPRPAKPKKPPEWHEQLVKDASGKPERGMVNATIAMREDPALSGILGYDPQLRKVVLKARLPDDWEPGFRMRVIEEPDFLSLYEYLIRTGFRLTKEEMKTVIRKIARENPLGAADAG